MPTVDAMLSASNISKVLIDYNGTARTGARAATLRVGWSVRQVSTILSSHSTPRSARVRWFKTAFACRVDLFETSILAPSLVPTR
jgi:hypothetical protein